MTDEIWKDVPGYEGRYQASDQGRVRSVDRLVRGVSKKGLVYPRPAKGRVLKPAYCRDYLIVNLYPYGTLAVHLIVARTFIPRTAPEVNHKDGVKENCRVSNLEWVTKKENQAHATNLGLRKSAIAVVAPSGIIYPSITRAARAEKVRAATAAKWDRA